MNLSVSLYIPPLSPPLPTIAIGRRDDLETRQKRDISLLVIENLTTNQPKVTTAWYNIEPVSKRTLKDRIHLLCEHFKNNTTLYWNVLKAVALLTTACVVGFLAVKFFGSYLANLYDNILHGRLVYQGYPLDGVPVGWDYYYEDVFSVWCIYFIIFGCGLASGKYLYETLKDLKTSLGQFFESPHRLVREINLRDSSFPQFDKTVLANDKEGSNFRDPITWDDLKGEWIHAPRFIKIGHYVFAFDTLLKRLFDKPLLNGKRIHHPIEERYLDDREQEKLISDLSRLLGLDSSKFLNYWDPYYQDPRKNNPLHPFSEMLRDRPEILQFALLYDDLRKMIPDAYRFNAEQIAQIGREIKNDLFASKRLRNFLDQLPPEVLALNIKKDEANSVTLMSIIKEEEKRTYPYHIPA